VSQEGPEDLDLRYAELLLFGFGPFSEATAKNSFPTNTTKPTEKTCRAALARVLMRQDPPVEILNALAALFYPPAHEDAARDLKYRDPFLEFLRPRRAVEFKNFNQGARDIDRESRIARLMWDLERYDGLSYEDAAAKVADMFGYKETRQVKRFFGRWLSFFKWEEHATNIGLPPEGQTWRLPPQRKRRRK
jgi:hypothetical protein